MNRKESNFKSENLVVHWLAFKVKKTEPFDRERLIQYLSLLGFNSYETYGQEDNSTKEPLLVKLENKFEVMFVNGDYYWKSNLIAFPGRSAIYFYSFVKKKAIRWEFLSPAILSRVDLHYSRKNQEKDDASVSEFFETSHRKLQQTNRNAILEKNSKGMILKIGHRKSQHYVRIYENKNALRFEYEIKGKFGGEYHSLLVSNELQEFEQKLSAHFFSHFGKLLFLGYSYTDWLVFKLRPIRNRKQNPLPKGHGLKVEYLQTQDFKKESDRKSFFIFLQFIVFAETLDYEKYYLKTTPYRIVSFQVRDFLKYTGESTHSYQLSRMRKLLTDLQLNSVIRFFSESYYRSLVTIPEVVLYRGKYNAWTVDVQVAEELFYYPHPYNLPPFFNRKLTKYEFEVQFHVIQTFNAQAICKKFFVKEFIEFQFQLSNQDKTKVKEHFLKSIEVLEKEGLVDSHYQIIIDGKLYDTKELTTRNISEGFVVFEKMDF